jgi:Flp pilus assembly pilin Flp
MAYHLELWKSPRLRLVGKRAIANANLLRRDASAITSIEYALLASFIAVTIAGICSMMFGKLSDEYTEIANIFS